MQRILCTLFAKKFFIFAMAIIWYDTIPRLSPLAEPLNRAGYLQGKTSTVDRLFDHLAFCWRVGSPEMKLKIRTRGREMIVTRPHCTLTLPGEHTVTTPLLPCNEFYFVFKNPDRLFGGLQPEREDFGLYFPEENSDFFFYLEQFMRLFDAPLSPSVCTQLDCLALAILSCTFYRGKRNDRPSPIEEIEGYIFNHYSDDLDLSALAKRFNLSFATFRRLWQMRNPDPPGITIRKLRDRHAKDLLSNRRLSIGEVAEMSGYPNIHYFSRFFRRMNNMTPSEFRARTQKSKD